MRATTVLIIALGLGPAAAAPQPVASHARSVAPRPAPRVVARVNGVPLMSDRLDASVNATIPLESFHRTVNAEKLREFRARALRQLIDEELQYQAGVRLGVAVADAEVATGVALARSRYRSPQAFEAALQRAGISLADVRREIRRALVIRKARDRFVTAQCQVDRDEARRFFTANPERFVVPEQLRIQAITIGVDPSSSAKQWQDARGRADDVLRRLQAGAPFQDLARAYSTDPSRDRGGDMGFVHRGSLNDDFEKATRDLKAGQASGVVQSLFGYHIVRVAEVRPPVKKTFAEVGAALRTDLTKKRCDETAEAWLVRLRARAAIVVADTAAAPAGDGGRGERR
jgi:peptidyl-prolyl cis-trans isomerase C